MDSLFICPVCGELLRQEENSYLCVRRHTFDISRKGYVNLLLSQQSSSKRHGDDKRMIQARTDFLNKGYYLPLRNQLTELTAQYAQNRTAPLLIADAGCGEGWYTDAIEQKLFSLGKQAAVCGFDISKEALIAAHRRNPRLQLAVSSIVRLPLRENSCDFLYNIFAPHSPTEFFRVLKRDGYLFRIIPLEEHLMGLKRAVYDKVKPNIVDSIPLDGFELLQQKNIKYSLILENNQDILSLFRMTPYYYKTGSQDQEKLNRLDHLETEIAFAILVYRKK